MVVNKLLFKMAINLKEFQEFMKYEIKVNDIELEKLKGCRACLDKFKWTDRVIKKVNAKLCELDKEKKIFPAKKLTALHKITKVKSEAIEFINANQGVSFQIIIRK